MSQVWASVLMVLFCFFAPVATSAERKSEIVVLYSSGSGLPSSEAVRDGIGSVLLPQADIGPDLYEEYLDTARFSGPEHLALIASLLEAKYADRAIEVVVAVGPAAFEFALQNKASLFPFAKLVFAGIRPERLQDRNLPSGTYGIVSELDPVKTLELALMLQPATRNGIVITGSAALDKDWEEIARTKFASFEDRLSFTFLAGLTLEDVLEEVASLPPDSIVIYLSMFEDGAGRKFVPREVAGKIASAANAPTYSVYDTYVGQGIVGGYMDTFTAVGRATGTIIQEILAGGEPDVAVRQAQIHKFVVDGRQIERWRLDESRLPRGTEVRYRSPSMWDQYRNEMLAGLGLLALQFIFIVALLIERRHRHSIERNLRESEERYRNVVETQSELICRYLPDTTLTFVNDAYCRYFNRTRKRLVGAKWLELIPEAARGATLRQVGSLIARGGADSYEHEVLKPDGTVGWQQWTDRVIFDVGRGVVEIQAVGRDLTELKHAEAETLHHRRELAHLTRVSVVGALSGALAHELNQPLTAILSNAQAATRLISREPVDVAEIKQILKDIVDDDKRAGLVIQHLRSLLKKDTPDRSPVHVNDLIAGALGICSSDLILRDVQVSRRLAAGLPEIRADPVQLQQVLLNLIRNACEAMSGTAPQKRLLRLSSERRGSSVRVSVTDSGAGIPAEAIHELYKPFFTTKSLGLGLGLPICKWILETHGGRLEAKNNLGGGATFYIELPVEKEPRHVRPVAYSVSG